MQTGCPIVVVRSRRFDPRTRSVDASVRATVSVLERALARAPSETVCVYYDRTGFDLRRNLDVDFLREVVRVLSDNYPEVLDSVYVYPTGGAFRVAWAAVAPLLNSRTRSKVVLPTSMDELLEAIPHPLVLDGL